MLAKVHSGAVYGVDAYAVEIEVNTGRGGVSPEKAFIYNVGFWREVAA